MPQTRIRGSVIEDGSILRADLNTVTPGSAVITKVLAGSGISITSTGVDAGTGDVTINASGGGSPGGVTGNVQFNDSGAFNGATNVEIDNGDLGLDSSASPVTPPSGRIKLRALNEVGQTALYLLNNKGVNKRLFPEGRFVARFQAMSGSNALTGHHGLLFTATGTATAVSAAATNRYTRTSRVEALVTVAATTAVAGFRCTNANLFTGSGTVDGGYWLRLIAGPATGVATATSRFWMGVGQTAASTDVEPSSVTNSIGVGYDAADATLFVMTRGAGAVIKTNTGITVPTADRTALYEILIYQPAGATQEAYIKVTDIINGTTFELTETTAGNLPASGISLTPKLYSSVGGTSSVIGVALHSALVTSDF
jgi:hypothetical protein